MAEPETPVAMDAGGVSAETHQHVKSENDKLREQLAAMKARNEVYENRQREQLSGMKSDVVGFVDDIVTNNAQYPELGMMQRWAADLEKSESVETTLGLGRLISCASANFKRVREEASQASEKSTALADAYKKIEALETERDSKSTRVTELEGLVNERTAAAEKLQQELARAGAITEKYDFSLASSREGGVSGAGGAGASASAPANNARPEDDLFAFINNGGRGGLTMKPSGTVHSLLGASGNPESDIAAALRI